MYWAAVESQAPGAVDVVVAVSPPVLNGVAGELFYANPSSTRSSARSNTASMSMGPASWAKEAARRG